MHWPRTRLTGILIGAAAILAMALLLALACFPVGVLKGAAERRLTHDPDQPARIERIKRESWFSFAPVIRIEGVHVPQPRWAGTGDLANIRLLRMRLPILPLLVGKFAPALLTVSGAHLDLIRTADGRDNYRSTGKGSGDATSSPLEGLQSADAVIRYRDAMKLRSALVTLRADAANGVQVRGTGEVDGAPVTIAAQGPALTPGQAWPFTAAVDGQLIAIQVRGATDAPLRMNHMRFHMRARADDLKRIDRVIEAGLFGTGAIDLQADVRHDAGHWTIDDLAGTIGANTRVRGHASVDKSRPRTRIDAEVWASQLDFGDLANSEGKAKAAALEKREGPRMVPNTKVNLHKLWHTDGRIAFHVAHLVSRGGSALRTVEGVLTLDHMLLTADPLAFGLTRGTMRGRIAVDQREGRHEPVVGVALDIRDSSIAAFTGGNDQEVDARLDAHARLSGPGSTFREAMGHASGSAALVARNGVLPAKLASQLGFDLARSLFSSGDQPARLRCAVARLDLRDGQGRFDPLLIDTDRSQTHGSGTLRFPDERFAVTLTGAPKEDSLLRLPGNYIIDGTIREPHVTVPPRVKSVGNIFKAIGRAISGDQGPTAADADCAALARRALQ